MAIYYFEDKDAPPEKLGDLAIKQGFICVYRSNNGSLRVEQYSAGNWYLMEGDLYKYMQTRFLIEGISLD